MLDLNNELGNNDWLARGENNVCEGIDGLRLVLLGFLLGFFFENHWLEGGCQRKRGQLQIGEELGRRRLSGFCDCGFFVKELLGFFVFIVNVEFDSGFSVWSEGEELWLFGNGFSNGYRNVFNGGSDGGFDGGFYLESCLEGNRFFGNGFSNRGFGFFNLAGCLVAVVNPTSRFPGILSEEFAIEGDRINLLLGQGLGTRNGLVGDRMGNGEKGRAAVVFVFLIAGVGEPADAKGKGKGKGNGDHSCEDVNNSSSNHGDDDSCV